MLMATTVVAAVLVKAHEAHVSQIRLLAARFHSPKRRATPVRACLGSTGGSSTGADAGFHGAPTPSRYRRRVWRLPPRSAGTQGLGARFWPIIVQGGNVFRESVSDPLAFEGDGWVAFAMSGLTPSDFSTISGSGSLDLSTSGARRSPSV